MKNKKGDFNLMPVLIAFIIILVVNLAVLGYINFKNNKMCENACGNAITFDVKEKDSLINFFIGDYEVNCICYYEDGTKTKVVKK